MFINRICKECGKEFKTNSNRIKNNRGLFCSRSCSSRYNRRSGFIEKICPVCNKSFLVKPFYKEIRKFCSISCSNKSRKSGIKKPRSKKYYYINKEIKTKIITEAWGEKCYICGESRVRIIHKKNGKKHKLFSNQTISEMTTEIENHKDEYVRVCGLCHKAIHWNMKFLSLSWNEIIERLKYKNNC